MAKTNITINDINKLYDEYESVENELNDATDREGNLRRLLIQARRERNESRFGEHDDDPKLLAERERNTDDVIRLSNELDLASLVLETTKKIHANQVKNIVKRMMLEHKDEYLGKPAHYKRTKSLIEGFVNDALDGTGCKVRVISERDYFHSYISIESTDASHPYRDYFGRDNQLDLDIKDHHTNILLDEYMTNWYKPNDAVDGMTLNDVRAKCRKFIKAREQIRKLKNEYLLNCKKIADEFDFVYLAGKLHDDSECSGYEIRSAKPSNA